MQSTTYPSADGFSGVRLLRFPRLTDHHPLPRRPHCPPPPAQGASTRPASQPRRRWRRSAPAPGTQLRTSQRHSHKGERRSIARRTPRTGESRRVPEAERDREEGGWERALARGARGDGTRGLSSPPQSSLAPRRRSGNSGVLVTAGVSYVIFYKNEYNT